MQILMYRPSFELMKAELSRRQVDALILEHDGTLVDPEGRPCPDAAPTAAWFSRELIVTPGAPVRDFIKRVHGGSVEWVQSAAAGYEHPVFQGILDAGIRLSSSDGNSAGIAEYVLAEVLACFQRIEDRRAAQAAKNWERIDFREIAGSRWLILGYGSIGREVARRATAFGAEVVGMRRRPQPDAHALRVVGPGDLLEEVPAADVIVISAAANADSTHLVDADVLSRMRENAVLVNVARGSLIDSTALLRALDSGRPGWAILDVFDTEPLPADDPIWSHPKVRVSAHCSGAGDGVNRRGAEVFLEHLDAWLAGLPLRLEVTSP
ncbi:MAG: D-2-hydroxyacid dehydrogenase [Gammaproteobacteria bacterium]|nr:D-2-hydroxyacid dehydrogenase [Gammaproteobacteria bacterium]